MDTIHTLNTSLPSSSSRSQDQLPSNHQRQASHSHNSNNINNNNRPASSAPKFPPPSLHAAFKAAAFSVAQLYKTAATESDSWRAAGYQDAIDDLLAFLDQENLGLGDGEGWRVRQWATERLEPSIYGTTNSDADDEYVKDNQSHKATETDRSEDAANAKQQPETREPDTAAAADDSTQTASPSPASTSTPTTADTPDMFRFGSIPAHPDTDMTHDDAVFNFNSPVVAAKSPTSLRLNLRPHRFGNSNVARGRNGHIASMSLGSLGLGSGTKRKTPPGFADFFDFGMFGNGNGGGGGGGGSGGSSGSGGMKRGRME